MESFLDEVKKKVQCSLCEDTLIEPKILKCFHTFCKPCIKRHTELIKEANVFKCPKCSSETCLPRLSSVDDLLPSTLHSRILKGLSMVESEKVCSVSESHSPATWYCFDCDHSLCQECRNYHSFFIKDHKLVRLADLKRGDFDLIISRENHCENHPNQRLDLCCEDCDVLICVTCLKQAHRHHKTITLDEFASIKKALLLKHRQVLEHLRLDDKEKQEQQEIAYRITQEGEKAIKEVKDKIKEMIEILQESERELLRQIHEKLYTATRNLNIIHYLPAVNEYINNVMEGGLASEMVNIQETECSEKFIFNFIPPYTKITFVPNEELMKQVNSGLGEIQTKRTDHEMRSLLVESELQDSKKNKLQFSTTELLKGEFKISTDEENTEEIDVRLFQTVPIILEFIFTVEKYKKKIKTIESEFSVKISGAGNGSKVGIYPTTRCSQPKYDDACEEYIKLYREITEGNMMCKDLVLKPGKGSNYLSADEAVKEVLQEAPVVVQLLEEPDTWLFYGEDANVRSVIKEVCKKLKMDDPFQKTRKAKSPIKDTKRYGDSTCSLSGRIDTKKDKRRIPAPTNGPHPVLNLKFYYLAAAKDEEDVCSICLDGFHDPVTLQKCNHQFCKSCIDRAFSHRNACPTCGMSYGVQTGNMPQGTMNWRSSYHRLPGYEKYGAIEIMYSFPSGIQGPEHPNPGQRYYGTSRTAYLPDCPEGREVLGLLKKAFDARLTFTIGTSVTTGATNTVTWNDIHHKTSPHGGITYFGYPDPTYLQRVKAELAAKGIS